jgi:hypothetical protein
LYFVNFALVDHNVYFNSTVIYIIVIGSMSCEYNYMHLLLRVVLFMLVFIVVCIHIATCYNLIALYDMYICRDAIQSVESFICESIS